MKSTGISCDGATLLEIIPMLRGMLSSRDTIQYETECGLMIGSFGWTVKKTK